MLSSFLPRLVNTPFGDPGLYIPFLFEKRAMIFDLGDIFSLSPKEILKISHVFITHTHMDHFVGFERLLRLLLGREKDLFLFGPEGFMENIEGKLAGYTWNLLDKYENQLNLHVTEVHSDHLFSKQYSCKDGFVGPKQYEKNIFKNTLLEEPALSVYAALLDHSIVSLGFTIKERFHVNIMKDAVKSMGLEIGPWLKDFKQALFNNTPPDSKFEVKLDKTQTKSTEFAIGELSDKIARITPGQKVTYITDVAYTSRNIEKMVDFADRADHLFIEAAFLDKDREAAKEKHHLTAGQAGSIARMADVKRFTLFHHSPRYMSQENLLNEEAMRAYNST
jgi:ribonuclease Z